MRPLGLFFSCQLMFNKLSCGQHTNRKKQPIIKMERLHYQFFVIYPQAGNRWCRPTTVTGWELWQLQPEVVQTWRKNMLYRMKLSGNVGHVTIFSWMFTIACCLVVGFGLGSGLGLYLVFGWLVVMHMYFSYFLLSLLLCRFADRPIRGQWIRGMTALFRAIT